MYDIERAPTQEQVEKFLYLSPMLDSALLEMREFAKKKQDGIVSATKIKILNRLLGEIRSLLANEESVGYLDPLDEQQLPENSDAVLILGQYRAAMNSFKDTHYFQAGGYNKVWVTKEWIEKHGEEYDDEAEEDEGDEESDK